MSAFLHRLFRLSAFLLMASAAYAQGTYNTLDIGGIEYAKLPEVAKWYGFAPMKGRAGCVTYGAKDRRISVTPQKQDFYVNNYRYILSYPVRESGGQLLISCTDLRKLVDPVLRPKFSEAAGTLTTVVIDPGHGGHDAGAVSPYAREKDCNLAVGLKLRDKLKKLGFKVVMTRDKDFFLTLRQRVEIANQVPDSIFVSVHHNSSGSHATGIETFTLAPHGTTSPFARTRRTEDLAGNNQDSENIALATAVHSRAIRSSKAIDRGIQRARFSVLCTINRPAILFEGGFVSNPEEGRKISDPAYQDMLAESIAQGIVAYGNQVCRKRPAGATARPAATPTPGRGNVRTSISGSKINTITGGKK